MLIYRLLIETCFFLLKEREEMNEASLVERNEHQVKSKLNFFEIFFLTTISHQLHKNMNSYFLTFSQLEHKFIYICALLLQIPYAVLQKS